jgi:transposase InsO family protein
LETPLAPGQAYNIDYMTDLPRSLYMGLWYTMAMVIVDRCSLRCYILPCRKIDDAASAAELFFDRIVCDECNGVPLYLVSDRDTRFNNKFWQELHRLFGTQIRMSSARSQQTNGLAERTICVIEECLRSCINYKQDNWCELRSSIVLTLNQAPKTKLMNKSPMYYEHSDCIAITRHAYTRNRSHGSPGTRSIPT